LEGFYDFLIKFDLRLIESDPIQEMYIVSKSHRLAFIKKQTINFLNKKITRVKIYIPLIKSRGQKFKIQDTIDVKF